MANGEGRGRRNDVRTAQKSVRIKRFDHDGRVTRDLKRTRWFYGEVLGLSELSRPENFGFGGCWFRGPGFELHFILASNATAQIAERAGEGFADAARMGLDDHLAFEVEDLETTLTRLRERGVEILSGPVPRGDGAMQAYVHDPDGRILEFLSWDRG